MRGSIGDLKDRFKQTIQAFANLLEDKDPYTRGATPSASASTLA